MDGGSFVLRYVRPHGRTDVNYQVLSSENLATWPLPALSDLSDGAVTALGEPRKAILPSNAPRKFVRIKVSLLP